MYRSKATTQSAGVAKNKILMCVTLRYRDGSNSSRKRLIRIMRDQSERGVFQ